MNLAQGVREGMDRGHGQSKVNCCSGPAWPSRIQKGQLLVWVISSEARSHHTKKLKMHPDPHVTAQTGLDSG